MSSSNSPARTIPPAIAALSIRTLPLKVSAKGAVSVYGLGRFPVTLYTSQMTALLDNKDAILAFIAANAGSLAVKL